MDSAVRVNTERSPLAPLERLDAYWRAANYLSVGQIYLLDNPLLRKPLAPQHIKPPLEGGHDHDVLRHGGAERPGSLSPRKRCDRSTSAARAAMGYVKQALRDKLIEHGEYIREHGEDMTEICNWRWES